MTPQDFEFVVTLKTLVVDVILVKLEHDAPLQYSANNSTFSQVVPALPLQLIL
jgi:hypothetical protein